MNTPEIPFGYKRVFGQLQKGDGVWDGQKFKKVRKELVPVTVMRMRWPIVQQAATIAIRRCTVEQAPLPLEPSPADQVKAHQYLYYVAAKPVWSDYQYDVFCKEHGIEGGGGSDRAQDYSPEIIKLAEGMPVKTEETFEA